MFEYFNFLSGSKSLSIAGMQLHPLVLVAVAAVVVAIMLYALLKMTR